MVGHTSSTPPHRPRICRIILISSPTRSDFDSTLHRLLSSSARFAAWALKFTVTQSLNDPLYKTLERDPRVVVERFAPMALPLVVGQGLGTETAPSSFWQFGTGEEGDDEVLAIYVDQVVVEMPPRWVRGFQIHAEQRGVALISLNAKISTLGGGYFLCRKVNQAWTMAKQQLVVAMMLGDHELAGQCRVHLSYICMLTGRLRAAERRLNEELEFARKMQSDRLAAVVDAAQYYLGKLQEKVKSDGMELARRPKDVTRDNFYRQRFVILQQQRHASKAHRR